ncbi:MAG TPA: hypothetical protein VLE48_06210 [Terriglobales bacterium]|nr:hypothetical protein [Terriglobales bacterium]
MACQICETRKEKRFCPAVHGRICAVCCGTEREVTLDCPSDCPYLRQAREREKPRALNQLDPAEVFAEVEIRDALLHQREPLIVGLSFALAKSARAERSLVDRDLIGALSALARRYQTLASSGLITGTEQGLGPQQAIVAELEKMIAGYRETEQKHVGYATLRDSEVLEALVFLVRMAQARTSGRPKSRAFLDFLYSRFPEKEPAIVAPDAGRSIVIP